MKIFKKILSISLRVIIILLLCLLILGVSCNLYFNIQKNNGEDRPNIFGFAPISVTDNKLSPKVNEGDFLIISKSDKYEVGDVVTLEIGGEYVTQMIIKVEHFSGREDVKQYDLSNHSSVSPDMVYGKMMLKLGGFAPVITFFQTVPGVIILIVFAVLLILLPNILSLIGKKKENVRIRK